MSRALVFDTRVDRAVRRSNLTRSKFAQEARVSAATLLKARALDDDRGKLHWTSWVLIGTRLGVFAYNESVKQDDPRLRKLSQGFISYRGSAAWQWYGS